MSHDGDGFILMAQSEFLQRCTATRKKIRRTFPAGHGVMRITRHEPFISLGFAGLHFLLRHALKDAEMPFTQTFIGENVVTGDDGDLFSGARGTREVAGIQLGESLCFEANAELLRLPKSAFSQRAVELALHAPFGVPQRFAVADQDELGHSENGGWWIVAGGW